MFCAILNFQTHSRTDQRDIPPPLGENDDIGISYYRDVTNIALDNKTSADIRMRWLTSRKLKQSDRNGSEQVTVHSVTSNNASRCTEMLLLQHFAPQTSGFPDILSENHLEFDGGVNCNRSNSNPSRFFVYNLDFLIHGYII